MLLVHSHFLILMFSLSFYGDHVRDDHGHDDHGGGDLCGGAHGLNVIEHDENESVQCGVQTLFQLSEYS